MNSSRSIETHPAAAAAERLLVECDVRRLRRSGPGGQHRNKVETAVALRHRPTGVAAEASERRSQSENQHVALFRLRVNLALEVRLQAPAGRDPSVLWQTRVRGGRIAVNPGHDDFPTLLAEALDHVAAVDWDVKLATERLGVTPSQLVKFLKLEPRALAIVNAQRVERGAGTLR